METIERASEPVIKMNVEGIEESNRRVAAVKARVRTALEAAGCKADQEVRYVDGAYVGLFALPSNGGHVYVGFGKCGSHVAHRGQEAAMDDAAVAALIAAYAVAQGPAPTA